MANVCVCVHVSDGDNRWCCKEQNSRLYICVQSSKSGSESTCQHRDFEAYGVEAGRQFSLLIRSARFLGEQRISLTRDCFRHYVFRQLFLLLS